MIGSSDVMGWVLVAADDDDGHHCLIGGGKRREEVATHQSEDCERGLDW